MTSRTVDAVPVTVRAVLSADLPPAVPEPREKEGEEEDAPTLPDDRAAPGRDDAASMSISGAGPAFVSNAEADEPPPPLASAAFFAGGRASSGIAACG